ncbi:MAG TPA: hypothetical protein VFB78_10085 [Acidimicrobiales bacterium]|nr:hypothetical protein [Acidimicrobiales bacterium]
MSLTEAEHVFAGLHEDGINDFLTAFFRVRRHHLRYGSSFFVPATNASETRMDAIPFPNVPGGIQWAVEFAIPTVDFFKDSSGGGMPSQLVLDINHLSLHTRCVISLVCGLVRVRDHGDDRGHDDKPDDKPPDRQAFGSAHVERAVFDVWAIGHPVTRFTGGGSGSLGFAIDAVELVDITPDPLESLLECLIQTLLQAALVDVALPFRSLRAGAFSLTLQRGPEIEDDQAKVYGTT